MQIKPLEWTEPAPPNGKDRFYDHVLADTPFGQFSIEWKSWKKPFEMYDVFFDNGQIVGSYFKLDEAKSGAFEWFVKKLKECHVDDTG